MNYTLKNLHEINISLKAGDVVFLIGDLGAGKTTLTKQLLSKYGIDPTGVRSPTYTYMQEYTGIDMNKNAQKFHHFDLYRLDDYDSFLNIGGQDSLDDSHSIKIVEWPEILFGYFSPTYTITIQIPPESDDTREYLIET